ncbi:hypothetical protein VNO80_11034 [Phaseolus coccineus]|uniref:Uncharacterized protein n=1 Tax=Phaseolus coccineus TaxID=3886 RepID=A0AAN9N9B9_PHACN
MLYKVTLNVLQSPIGMRKLVDCNHLLYLAMKVMVCSKQQDTVIGIYTPTEFREKRTQFCCAQIFRYFCEANSGMEMS